MPLKEPDADEVRDPTGAQSVTDESNRDTWNYAKSNPAEHFAEVYAKAVEAPDKLHNDLVDMPRAAAQQADAAVLVREQALHQLETAKDRDPMQIAEMQSDLARAKGEATFADTALAQRSEQYRIMRDDVFHTDRAASLAASRLEFANMPADRIAAFRSAAERAATPKQIEELEAEYRR